MLYRPLHEPSIFCVNLSFKHKSESHCFYHNRTKFLRENPDDYPLLLLLHAIWLQHLQQNTVYLFLPPEQHSLLNQLLLELQTLVQGPHLALHVCSLSLSQIPGGEQDRGCIVPSLLSKCRPPLLRSLRWCNPIFKGPQCSRNPNGKQKSK